MTLTIMVVIRTVIIIEATTATDTTIFTVVVIITMGSRLVVPVIIKARQSSLQSSIVKKLSVMRQLVMLRSHICLGVSKVTVLKLLIVLVVKNFDCKCHPNNANGRNKL
jgi:Rad3-related DNA helicase